MSLVNNVSIPGIEEVTRSGLLIVPIDTCIIYLVLCKHNSKPVP